MNSVPRLTAGAVLVATGVLLPVFFHFWGALGPVFLPMHIPVFLAGLLLGPAWGLAVGVVTPVLSSLLTGMPPLFPVMPIMTAELGVYGLVSGYCYQARKWPLPGALLASMAAGRVAACAAAWVLMEVFGIRLKPSVYVTAAVITGLPGLAIQLIVVPLAVAKLQSALGRGGRYNLFAREDS